MIIKNISNVLVHLICRTCAKRKFIAQNIGVSQKAIDYWERGVNEPKASYIIALVKYFNISFDEFFS